MIKQKLTFQKRAVKNKKDFFSLTAILIEFLLKRMCLIINCLHLITIPKKGTAISYEYTPF
jgi:hypothetical protein